MTFYVLVKELGLSPADTIADMTPLQQEVLVRVWNKIQEKQMKEAKKAQKSRR